MYSGGRMNCTRNDYSTNYCQKFSHDVKYICFGADQSDLFRFLMVGVSSARHRFEGFDLRFSLVEKQRCLSCLVALTRQDSSHVFPSCVQLPCVWAYVLWFVAQISCIILLLLWLLRFSISPWNLTCRHFRSCWHSVYHSCYFSGSSSSITTTAHCCCCSCCCWRAIVVK